MTPAQLVRTLSCPALVLLLAACGGNKPPPAAQPAAPASVEKTAGSAASAPEAAPASSATPSAGRDDSDSKPSRPPVDMLTAPTVAFVLDFPSSDIGEAADKKCASEDPAKDAACKAKQRADFLADVLEFSSKNDQVTFVIYRRKGTTLTKLSSNSVKLTEKSPNTATVEITGDDKKPRVLFPRTRKFDVVVPNDYSIEIHEPTAGKLVYNTKIGILGD